MIILAVLDVIAAEDLDLAQVVILLPVEEIDFLQKFLLVILELPHPATLLDSF